MKGRKEQRILELYLTVLDALMAIGDSVMTLGYTLIVAFGVPLALAALLVVEHHGVLIGIQWFELSTDIASFGAYALVLLNVALEFQITGVENRAKHRRDSYQASLHFTLENAMYWLGVGSKWKARKLSPAQRVIDLQKSTTYIILAMTVLGRMKAQIDAASVQQWNEGIRYIFVESTLGDVATWITGLVFSYAAVRGAQVLANYMALQVIDIKRRMVVKRQKVDKAARSYVDAYAIETVRDNTLKPMREGAIYICPKCEKRMSKQGWSTHPCRKVDHILTDTRPSLDQLDESIGQESLVEVYQSSSNGKH